MKRREARQQEQADARERADRHREELIARLRGDSATPTEPAEAPPADDAETTQEDAMSDKTPKRPPKKKKPKA